MVPMTLTPMKPDPYVGRAPNPSTRGKCMGGGRPGAKLSPTQATLIIVVVLLVTSGCKTGVDIPDVVREPEVVGEVLDVAAPPEEGPRERRARFTLRDDRAVDIDLNSARNIGGPEPAEGQLLLYGTQPDGPWFWSGPLLDDPVTGRQCAGIVGRALDEGESIVFEIGLRLPKAEDFDPAEVRDGVFSNPVREFCIDEHGEVTRYGV